MKISAKLITLNIPKHVKGLPFVTEEKTRKRKGIVHINHDYCKRCGICVNFCPVKNLEIRQQNLMELEHCIACRTCERYCPDIL